MRTIFRRLTQSLIISILSVIVLGCSAYAANIDATVPASLPITVSSDGVVTTATNAAIHNYGSSPIFVSSINVTAENGWSLVTKDAAASASIGAKVISMGFNGSWMDASGAVDTSSFDRISSSGTLNLSYDAKTPGVVTAESSSTAATATFVVGLPTAPTMAAGSSWYKSAQDRNTITKITFMDSYTPASCDEKWAADVNGTGDITCYRTGTEIIIAGNGIGKILANANSSHLFSYSSGNSGFIELTSIENLALLDTSKITSMSQMFYDCSGLTSIDVSSFDTSNVTDMSYMFGSCHGLTSIDVSSFDTSSVTNMSDMFDDCHGLTSIDVSSFDTSNVTDMSCMFGYCSGLTSIDLSVFDTSKVTDMSDLFTYCSGLASIDLSVFDTSNVTNMSYMFGYSGGLATIYVSDKWNTDKVTRSNYMFSVCTKLKGAISYDSSKTDATYANWTTGYLTYKALPATLAAGSSWYKSSQNRNTITKITLMDSYTPSDNVDEKWAADADGTGAITCYRSGSEIIMAGNGSGSIKANTDSSYLFSHTIYSSRFLNLKEIVNLPLLDTSEVEDMSNLFFCCRNITSLDLSGFNTLRVKSFNGIFRACGLTTLDLSSFNTSNAENMDWMFCAFAGSILDVSFLNTSKVTSMKKMFSDCRQITELDLSNFDTSKVTDMSFMFDSCGSLIDIDLSNFDTSNVENMRNMFASDENLRRIDLSNFNTSKVVNMSFMFSSCGLTSFDLSNFDTSKVTNMSSMFSYSKSVTSIDLSSFSTVNVTNMSFMFEGCTSLTSIYASDKWNTDKVSISVLMFSECTSLRGDIPYDGNFEDKAYAKTSGGYLTYKAASTKTLSLNIDPNSGAVTSYDVSTNPISRFRDFLDWSDTANVA